MSYGLFYAMMNVAAFICGFAIDALRLGLPNGLAALAGADSVGRCRLTL